MTSIQTPNVAPTFLKEFHKKIEFLNRTTLADPNYYHLLQLAIQSNQNRLKSDIRQYIKKKRTVLPFIEADQLLRTFHTNLRRCERYVHKDLLQFNATSEVLFGKSKYLDQINRLNLRVDQIRVKYSEHLQNLQNLRRCCYPENIQSYLAQRYEQILLSTAMSQSSSTTSSLNSERLQRRMEREIDQKSGVMKVPSEEIHELQAAMFTSEDSMKTRRKLGKQQIVDKELQLKSHIRTISDLEGNIADMQREMEIIALATEKAKRILDEKRIEMTLTVEELVRMNRMMESINAEIAQKIHAFQAELCGLETERKRILNDTSLSPERRAAMLEELNEKIRSLKETHGSALALLEGQRQEMTDQARQFNESITALRDNMLANLGSELNELEKSKIGKTASECALIDEQIRALREKTQGQVDIIGQAIGGGAEKLYDEMGRYYMNEKGEKVYKANSTASEYVMENGVLRKIRNALELLADEHGDYYLNELGEKIYHRRYEFDEYGRYYVDADGNRIYKRGPKTSEYVLINGKLVKVRDASGRSVSTTSIESDSAVDALAESRREQVIYVKDHLGKYLRIALAAAILHQPVDPINYIANHLLKQRHAELTVRVLQIEQQLLVEERERFRLSEELAARSTENPCHPCNPVDYST